MKTSLFHITLNIRFRRWNRKGYAAFRSIGNCVSIGNLRYTIADSSLAKRPEKQILSQLITEIIDKENYYDDLPDDQLLLDFLIQSFICQKHSEKNPAEKENTNYIQSRIGSLWTYGTTFSFLI